MPNPTKTLVQATWILLICMGCSDGPAGYSGHEVQDGGADTRKTDGIDVGTGGSSGDGGAAGAAGQGATGGSSGSAGGSGFAGAGGGAGDAGTGGSPDHPPPLTPNALIELMGPNDAPLPGANNNTSWAQGGFVVMGADLRGEATPTWWNSDNRYLGYWPWLAPWFVLWDGPNHHAGLNVRIALRQFETFVLDSSGQWIRGDAPGIDGEAFARNLVDPAGAADVRSEPDGSFSVRFNPGGDVFHGWAAQIHVDAPNVRGIHVRCQARKILHDENGPDERDEAQYLLSVGSDAYVYQGQLVSDFAPTGYNPGLGASKFTLVGNDWGYVGWVNLETAASVDSSSYSTTEPWRTMSEGELVTNPPPSQ